ncbi:MAG: NADH-quinone oxidoreductase subunit C [Dermatophilaceae bacterium]
MAHGTRVVEPAGWRDAVRAARDDGFTFFDWLSAADRNDDESAPGFDVVARLLDPATPGELPGVLVRTRVADGEPLESVTTVFAGAAWHERETHEMFGIEFAGFDDGTGLGLRPLLLPDGFEGTPLRKSFQLAARAAKPWPGGKEPGEGHDSVRSPGRRRVQAPGVPPPEWGPR